MIKKILISSLFFITCSINLFSQVTFDSKQTKTGVTSAGAAASTWAHNCGGTVNRVLLVFVSCKKHQTSISATYNGTAMTLIGSNATQTNEGAYLFLLISPSPGNHNVVVTSAPTGEDFAAVSLCYTGVNQTTPTEILSTASGNSALAAINNVDCPYAGDFVLGFVGSIKATSGVLGAGQTAVQTDVNGGGTHAEISSKPGAVGSLVNFTAVVASDEWAYIGVALRVIGSPLPIELLSFNALANTNRVDLTWETATETNNDFYTIERSKNAVDFEKVSNVDGAGNSTSLIKYMDIDNDPYTGVSYYRLCQTDFDGKHSYSNIVPVAYSPNGDPSITLFPNPANSETGASIALNYLSGQEILVVLRDIAGNEVYSKVIITGSDKEIVALDPEGKLAKGTYLVVASNENNFYSKKLIVK